MVSSEMLQAVEAEAAVLKIAKPATDRAEEVLQKGVEEEERQELARCLMEEEVEQGALRMVRARMVAETLMKAFVTSAVEVAFSL
jgi:hypothetical protein